MILYIEESKALKNKKKRMADFVKRNSSGSGEMEDTGEALSEIFGKEGTKRLLSLLTK